MTDNLIASISAKCGLDPMRSGEMFTALADIFKETMCENDSIALPGFGTFLTEKNDERIISDSATGTKRLVPPHIDVTFIPALKLAKSIKI